jgi:hypothetical protein
MSLSVRGRNHKINLSFSDSCQSVFATLENNWNQPIWFRIVGVELNGERKSVALTNRTTPLFLKPREELTLEIGVFLDFCLYESDRFSPTRILRSDKPVTLKWFLSQWSDEASFDRGVDCSFWTSEAVEVVATIQRGTQRNYRLLHSVTTHLVRTV